jgi:hypothetical protein
LADVTGGADGGRQGTRDACVVGVRGAGGPAGVGVLVSRHEVVTCAHVVNAALGLPPAAGDRPGRRRRRHLAAGGRPPSPSPRA